VGYIASCRELAKSLPERCPNGLEVLPPHVNESNLKFTVVGEGVGDIRFGLGAIRGVGESAVRSILASREAEGPFSSLFDFLCRIDLRLCNKRVAEALICAGALDGFAPAGRAQLLAALETTFAAAQQAQKERESLQENIFGELLGDFSASTAGIREPALPAVESWSESERLQREKEILGFFISGHPLDRYREDMFLFDRVNTANLKEHRDQKVELACVVTDVSRQISRRDGAEWGRITVEDFHGTATVLAFGDSWERNRDELQKDAPVLLRGSVSGRERDEEDPPIFLDGVTSLAAVRDSGSVAVCVELGHGADPDSIQRVSTLLAENGGAAPLLVRWRRGPAGASENGDSDDDSPRLRSRSLTVSPHAGLLRDLRDALGEAAVKLVKTW
jgi:DNA polymerase-3 subunit alpha